MSLITTTIAAKQRLWTVEEYHKMADTGILGPEERVIEPRNYIDHHPSPEEVFLLIEVAHRTLGFDRNTKATLYAKYQVTDYFSRENSVIKAQSLNIQLD